MKYQNIGHDGHTYLLVFDAGDEIAAGLRSFAVACGVGLASFTAVGALAAVELLAYHADAKEYRTAVRLDEQCELASMIGDIATHDGEPVVHAHLTIGRLDGITLAGHLKTAVVRPTCELFLTAHRDVIRKERNEQWNLPLFTL